jgi:very-short-patch-repair endonuclease
MARAKEYNRKELKERRRGLRNNGTPAEAILWKGLKAKQLKGRRFRRQFSVGNYILDFFCPSEKLCIELDGYSHFTELGVKKDQIRDKYLHGLGIKVLRFDNEDVYQNPSAVLEIISEHISD